MENASFSLLLWAKDTNQFYYRDLLESIVAQGYSNWALYVLDENPGDGIRAITEEFFPSDKRIHYRRIKNAKGQAYAYNIGFHFALQDAVKTQDKGYLVFIGQHDRLSPMTLESMAEEAAATGNGIIYTDHDLLIDGERMYPLFKPDLNIELLRHRNYVGDFFAVSYEAARALGELQEMLNFAWAYDYMLRALEEKIGFSHVPQLLYHQRLLPVVTKRLQKKMAEQDKAEHMVVAQAHFKRIGLDATVESGTDSTFWSVKYNGDGFLRNQKEYLFLHDKNARAISRGNLERMYSYIRQEDVAVVGARFFKTAFTVENCGYIFDGDGVSYPAFYETKSYQNSYLQMANIPRDVSAVDGAYCLIDAKIYRKLGGFDPKLTGRDVMLDFSLRARKAGFRTVVIPQVMVFRSKQQAESSEESNIRLYSQWEEQLKKGDPCYNINLPASLNNYSFF